MTELDQGAQPEKKELNQGNFYQNNRNTRLYFEKIIERLVQIK